MKRSVSACIGSPFCWARWMILSSMSVMLRMNVTFEYDQHPCVAKVAVVIDRDAAHVHADLARLERFEDFLAPGQRIVDLQHVSLVIGDAHLFQK